MSVLKWINENGSPCRSQTCRMAAGRGHLDALRWARLIGCRWDTQTCVYATIQGHLNILRRANEVPWGRQIYITAAHNGYLCILKVRLFLVV